MYLSFTGETMPTPTTEEIYEKAKELFFLDNIGWEITPTVEELKEGSWWKKAKIELMKNPETKYLPYQDEMEDAQLEAYESNLKKLTNKYSSKIIEVEINKIVPCPVLPSRHLGGLFEFALSIGKVSLLAPLILRKSKEKQGFYEIVCGYRRFEALKILSEEKVQAKVFDELPDEYVFAVSAIENWFHRGLSATEWALYLEKWKNSTGLTNKNIADLLGVEKAQISNYLRLLKLPEEFKKLNAFNYLSQNVGLQVLAVKDSEKQIEIGKEFDKVVKEKPHVPKHKLNKEFTKIMKKQKEKMVKKIPVDHLRKMLLEDLNDMMKQDSLTREAFAMHFWDACLKARIFEDCRYEAFHYIEVATKKKVADVFLDINLIKEEIVVGINSYREKDSSKWVPFELRFKSYRL